MTCTCLSLGVFGAGVLAYNALNFLGRSTVISNGVVMANEGSLLFPSEETAHFLKLTIQQVWKHLFDFFWVP
jgi:hypothetical protein